MTEFNLEFTPFPKIARLSRDIVITEKLDGTNACIRIGPDGEFLTGSRQRWITPEDDNYGFSKWAHEHKDELMLLGEGTHFGEWWGLGIQRNYGLKEKRFSLFNTARWNTEQRPECCHIVPTLFTGEFLTIDVHEILFKLVIDGSIAAPGFLKPEGIIIYHKHSNTLFKKTIDGDDKGKEYGK